MRLKNWLGTSILLAAFGLLGLPVLAHQNQSSGSQQTSDPVADAARKAREQQKTATKPKHVFTDDDVKHSTDTGSATPTPTGGQTAGDAKAGDKKGQGAQGTDAAGDKKDDPATTWRKRFADQRNRIAAAEKELAILQRELDKSQLQYYPDPQKAMQEQNNRQDIVDKTTKIDAKKQEIANLKQQLSDMEDELRKSGGDPGWVR